MKESKNIFKEKLGSFEVNDIQDEWHETEIGLHKMRFYKFSFTNFNIYYSSFLLLAVALSSTIFVKVFFFTDEIKSVNNSAVNNIENPLGKTEVEKLLKEKSNASNTNSNNNGSNILNNHQPIGETNRKVNNGQSSAGLSGSNDVSKGNTPSAEEVSGNNAQADNKISGNAPAGNESTGNKVSTSHDVQGKNISTSNEVSDTHSPGHGLTNTVNDNLNISPTKKNIVYITKQDTIEVYDTLRRKKPFKKSIKN